MQKDKNLTKTNGCAPKHPAGLPEHELTLGEWYEVHKEFRDGYEYKVLIRKIRKGVL